MRGMINPDSNVVLFVTVNQKALLDRVAEAGKRGVPVIGTKTITRTVMEEYEWVEVRGRGDRRRLFLTSRGERVRKECEHFQRVRS